MNQEVLFEVRGGALIVTFNRPQHGNAINLEMANQLFNRLKLVTTDRSVRAVMLRGAGGNFMTGVEMAMFGGNLDVALANVNQFIQPYHSAIRELQAMDKPVLAVVDGRAGGPGLSFMLASDFVLASESAMFNTAFTSHGMSPDGGASYFLTRKLGAARATELLMLSNDFGAEDAHKWGLINGVVPDAGLHEAALGWLDRLAAGPTRAFAAVRKLTQKAFEQDLNAHLGLEHTWWGATTRTFDFREAVKAYNEKRPARFTGA